MLKGRSPAVLLLACLCGTPALADDIRPEAGAPAQARPMADEKCIEQCDLASDKCMQESEGDAGKVQACDDKYSECLQKCEGG